jgi:hypothetical protein
LLWLLPTVAATAVVYWAGLHAGVATLWLLALATGAGAAVAMAASRSLPERRQLGWDGAQWTCDGRAVQPQVLIDIGPWVLLRLWPGPGASSAAPAAPRRVRHRAWLAVSVGDAGPAWHALRAALFARPPAPAASPYPSDNARQPPCKQDADADARR